MPATPVRIRSPHLAKILVVEDEQDTRVLLNAILRTELGHEVVFAHDGEAGIERYRETQPDLVITDLVMPQLHGILLIEHLRELHPGCRIIAMSGRAPEQLERARESGAMATLLKPIQRDEIVEVVEAALTDLDPWEHLIVGKRGLPGAEGAPVGEIVRSPMAAAHPEALDEEDAGAPDEGPEERPAPGRARSDTRLVDLSHVIEDGTVTYPGLPAAVICDYMSHEDSREHYAEGTEFQIGKIEMVANTGTYLDSPFHRFPGGKDVSELPLQSVASIEGVLAEAGGEVRAIGPELFEGLDVRGKAVLVETGWSRHWGSEAYMQGHPFLTREAAEHLVASGARLVGIDSLNIDDIDDRARPVHTVLLEAGIPIVEHLRGLDALRGRSFRFSAVPVKVKGFGTFPVRAFAELADVAD